jgi:hypothetical protein
MNGQNGEWEKRWNDEWGCGGSYEQMEYPPLPRPL